MVLRRTGQTSRTTFDAFKNAPTAFASYGLRELNYEHNGDEEKVTRVHYYTLTGRYTLTRAIVFTNHIVIDFPVYGVCFIPKW